LRTPQIKKNAVWKFLYIANDFIACCFIYFGNLETVFQKEIIYERGRKKLRRPNIEEKNSFRVFILLSKKFSSKV
jgi:hypothetical protein